MINQHAESVLSLYESVERSKINQKLYDKQYDLGCWLGGGEGRGGGDLLLRLDQHF